MRVAIIAEVAGAPLTLASTAFVGALAEGMRGAGAQVRIVGLAHTTRAWTTESLGFTDVSTPWISPPKLGLRDRLEAARVGVMDSVGDPGCLGCEIAEWPLELLVQRELAAIGEPDDDGVILVYPRSRTLLGTCVRVGRRLGWRVVVFATEALSDAQIDPATRDGYIECVTSHCDGVWSVSSYLADYWISRGVAAERIFVSVPPVRSSFFGESPPPAGASAVYLGNLQHREIEYLLDVAERVLAAVPRFQLVIYGDASAARRAELTSLIEERSLCGSVRLEAPVPGDRVPDVLAAANVLLLPRAHGEFSQAGFPNKLGEYLASGRPVIVTGVGDIPTYLADGVSACVVPPDDVEAFAAAVEGVLNDPEKAVGLGASGRAVASALSRADVVARRGLDFVAGLPAPDRTGAAGSAWSLDRLARLARSYAPDIKRAVVRVLRALRLKAPEPGTEERRAS